MRSFRAMQAGPPTLWLATCTAVFVVAACALPLETPGVDAAVIYTASTSDAVTVSIDPGAPAVVHVHDTRGIGALTLTAAGPITTPTHVRLYLAGLEGVEIRFADVVITGHGSQGGRVSGALSVAAGQAELPTVTAHTLDGAGATTAPLVDGYFEISLPASYLQTSDRRLTLAWVDFYR